MGNPFIFRPRRSTREHLCKRRGLEVKKCEVRDLLLVELLGEIGCGIELREDVIDTRKLIAAKIVMTTQRSPHFVEVPADLLERFL